MKSIKGSFRRLGLATTLPLFLLAGGCATHEVIDHQPEFDRGAMPLGADASVKSDLSSEEIRDQFRNLAAEDYVVQEGDTLWSIASHFLKDPYYWPEIWYDNPDVENPHLIYPGDTISIFSINGTPRLGVSMSPRIRYESLPPAISAIPLDIARAFMSHDQVLTQQDFDQAPYMLANRQGSSRMSRGDTAFVRPALASGVDQYAVVNQGEELIDGYTGEHLGFRAINAGTVQVTELGDPTTVRVINSKREIQEGDRLVPMLDEPFHGDLTPQIPAYAIQANIILLPDSLSGVGTYHTIFIDHGSHDGLEPGDMLEIHKRGEVITDRFSSVEEELEGAERHMDFEGPMVRLPDHRIGTAMVFRTFEDVSIALVIHSTEAINQHDLVRTPLEP